MRSVLFALAMAFAPAAPHDYFVSILTIHHDPVAQHLALTWKLTTHDVEDVIGPVAGKKLQLGGPNESPQADTLLKGYLLQHLRLSWGDSILNLRFIGKEVELEDLFCYLEVEHVPSTNGLDVRCDALQEVFADQVNEVHVETMDGIESHAFRYGGGPYRFGMARK